MTLNPKPLNPSTPKPMTLTMSTSDLNGSGFQVLLESSLLACKILGLTNYKVLEQSFEQSYLSLYQRIYLFIFIFFLGGGRKVEYSNN